MDDFQECFWLPFPRRRQTPSIRGNKKVLAKKLQAAVDRGDTTWEIIEEKVKLYAKSDTVAAGFIVLPATWCSETNDNGPGWSWEYEIPQTPEEILAAKPLVERTIEEWNEILLRSVGKKGEWATHYLKAHPELTAGAPEEILVEYGLEKNYG